ncbi:hypothetical protein A8F94_02460 [Bacillus sp. FJAT-27225]|uniref:DUF3231 family protein n=1 Tax=Bacillus sp. FJAT-27225 TaxID=1743144 RepID=UPI00080C2402|nr:DUF3231 family protein [Bacillus sp. FJAT-27225]OCA90760.1 hypothetical protein A8F94_02460 [Bacillus sp. FJAT-27225]
MGIMNGNPQDEPIHAGEVFHLWSHLLGTKAYLVALQVFSNHSGDHDLKVFIEDLMENCVKQEEQQVEAVLKENGIRLPPAPPDRPNVSTEDIPAGARFNDPEIAALLARDINGSNVLASYIMGIAIRADIRSMFGDFLTQKAEYADKLAELMKQKGWLILPPLNLK